jgi:release factor glutamine methyltransferase
MEADPRGRSLAEEVAAARARLVAEGLEPAAAAIDAEVLAREVLGWDRAKFIAEAREVPRHPFCERYRPLIDRRARREPVSSIVGHREFWQLEFEVTAEVLAPRPETEMLIEEALACVAPGMRRLRMLDVGTGSGCLAVSLAVEYPRATIIATDVSAPALAVARRNASRHGVSARVMMCRMAHLEAIGPQVDLIVSNPPYIPAAEIASLPPEVRDYEPRLALDGGADGLDIIRILVDEARLHLLKGGCLLFEFGFGQEAAVRQIVSNARELEFLRVRADLQGIPRAAVVRRAG